MKHLLSALVLLLNYFSLEAQCTSATVRETANINTPGHTLNSAFNGGPTSLATISGLSSGMFSFTGSVAGTATWSSGVQIQNDGTVGNYIFVQPNNTTNTTTGNIATYTIQFAEPVTNFSLRCAGLNNQDQLKITAFNDAAPITITAANFSDNIKDAGNSGVIVISGGNTLTGNNTAGGTGVLTNRITLTIPGPVTRIVMTSGKADAGNTSTVTLGFTSVSYTRCVKVPPDINATFVNIPVTGNVGTNDLKPAGTTYGTATAIPGNPGPAGILPTINSDGTYSFTSNVAGIFKFLVPMCPGSVVVPDCPTVELIIKVSQPTVATNTPFANTDMATTPINTAVTLNTLSNDKAGNNSSVALNPASVTITTPPAHGTTSINPATGNITFTPTTGYTGYDILTYQVCDLTSPTPLCASATQIITIIPTSTANSTVAADDYNSTSLNKPVSGNVKTNDTDPEGNPQTVTAQASTFISGKGTLNLAATGAYTFTPVSGFSGPVNYPYQTCDNVTPVAACTNATLYLLVFPSFPLPLDILKFQVTVKGSDAALVWKTANQDNVNRFEVERLILPLNNWTKISSVPASLSLSADYSWTDLNAKFLMEKGLYRLKMIDNDSRYTYSSSVMVNFGNGPLVKIQPSVAAAGQSVEVYTSGAANQPYTGKLFNQQGQLILQWTKENGTYFTIPAGRLSNGIYLVQIQQAGNTVTEKIIVQ